MSDGFTAGSTGSMEDMDSVTGSGSGMDWVTDSWIPDSVLQDTIKNFTSSLDAPDTLDWMSLFTSFNSTNPQAKIPFTLNQSILREEIIKMGIRISMNMRIDLWKELATPTPLPPISETEAQKQSDDAVWIMMCCILIFTMQSGFAQLEAGAVHVKNNVNIIMKNALDIVFGGVSFWMFGYGLAFGMDGYSNAFSGVGYFFVEVGEEKMGEIYLHFLFQLSFCSTATTIVSGAMAERTRLSAYVMFSFFNTIVYSFPAHWLWDDRGFLRVLGAVDIAGSGVVHLVGGVSGLVATTMLGPRHGRFDGPKTKPPPPGDVPACLYGTFTLWWGWLAFNCGSTFGVRDSLWKLAAKAAVSTMTSSMGGGVTAMIYSLATKKMQWDVGDFVYGVLGSLVSITAGCALISPWEGFIVGAIGGILSVITPPFLERLQIDDPVGVLPVHGVCAVWGMLAVGLFAVEDTKEGMSMGRAGLFHGGGVYLLGIQALAVISIFIWTLAAAFLLLEGVDVVIGLRLPLKEELVGSDLLEHDIRHPEFPITEEMEREARESPLNEKKSGVPGFRFGGKATGPRVWYHKLCLCWFNRTQDSENPVDGMEQDHSKIPSPQPGQAFSIVDLDPEDTDYGRCTRAPSIASFFSYDVMDPTQTVTVTSVSSSPSDFTRGSMENRLGVPSVLSGTWSAGHSPRTKVRSSSRSASPSPDLSSLDALSEV